MQNKLFKLTPLILAFLLSACGSLSEQADETKNWSDVKLYTEAKDELRSGNYDQSIKLFEKLESRYPFGNYARQAQLETAYAYYRQNDGTSALLAIERFIKLHPDHPNVDYAYYLRGLIHFNENLNALNFFAKQDATERDSKAALDAFNVFKQLTTRFPNSKYTPDSINRMKYLLNAIAQHEIHVANYYLKKGAYLAAANRAQHAITQYQGTPSTKEALLILIRSYDALGMTQLRDDAKRVFNANYPKNDQEDTRKIEKSWWQFW